MLVWEANFQIPNSGTQSRYVFLIADKSEETTILSFYSDEDGKNLLWSEEIDVPNSVVNVYDYLLSLEKYQSYQYK